MDGQFYTHFIRQANAFRPFGKEKQLFENDK